MSKSIGEKLQEWKQNGVPIDDEFSLAQNINLIINSIGGDVGSSVLSKILCSGDVDSLFLDNFTGGIKSEWDIIAGTWAHNSEFDALEVNLSYKNKIKVDIITPDNVLVECKIVKLNTLENTYFDLLNRHIFVDGNHSGYSLAYMEVYSRLYDYGLFLIRWDDNVRKGYLDYKTWAELGLSGAVDLEGKTIGIKCEGNVIKGYLDGVEILSATDDTYSSGQVGLLAQPRTEAFIFDDFKITSISGGE